MKRRDLLAGLSAAALVPRASWADARDPAFLSAARAADGRYHLCGLDEGGSLLFSIPLPDRGHAAAAHPTRPEAVAFARRPGRFAIIVDCVSGQEIARLEPPRDRHFYGHGTFSADGTILFTTENDTETLQGRIGLWDAASGYTRLGEVASGGVGPHDIKRLPGTETLVVANGGIATHPESGRTPLNLATMRANLAYIDQAGGLVELVELEMAQRRNSIRHLDVRADGVVAAGMQWNGAEGQHPPLVFLHSLGSDPRLLRAPDAEHRRLEGYVGSIAFNGDGSRVSITSPRGDMAQVFDVARGEHRETIHAGDICGLAADRGGALLATTGQGAIGRLDRGRLLELQRTSWSWDNHLVAV